MALASRAGSLVGMQFPALAASALALILANSSSALQEDPSKDARSKDPLVRLGAIGAIRQGGVERAEKILLGLLKDDDWEVRERAIEALGSLGTPRESFKKLLDQALEAPVRRMRWAAADALAQLAPAEAFEELTDKARSKTAIRASEALARLAVAVVPPEEYEASRFEKLLRDKEITVRQAAAHALAMVADPAVALPLALGNEDVVVRCAALDAVVGRPQAGAMPVLLQHLARAELYDVERRRVLAALEALLRSPETRDEAAALGKEELAKGQVPADRLARCAEITLRLGVSDDLFGADGGLGALQEIMSGEEPGRRAAVHALRVVGTVEARDLLEEAAVEDPSPTVRLVALRGLRSAYPPVMVAEGEELPDGAISYPDRARWLGACLEGEQDAGVREELCVQLAMEAEPAAYSALVKALRDDDWRVASIAAVSLGMTRPPDALPQLEAMLDDATWQRRGAAAVGIGHTIQEGMIEPLIATLGDGEPAVAHSALEGLHRVTGRFDLGLEQDLWEEWWKEQGGKVRLKDPKRDAERRKKYGYSRPDSEIYKGLDVIVFVSRGDHIQNIFDRREIEYRTTEAARVPECGVHPEAVFVSNCTGEIEEGDVEYLAWFVRVGGSFFGSCWALSQTIEKIYPGVVRKLPTRNEVLDDVTACVLADPETNPYLRGAFSSAFQPIYHLEGAHLIEVLFPERCEVLLDSPEATQRHGGGNLAVWFDAGHGVILDSVNHFDLQGLETAPGLKKPEERQAYAVDHMGLTYPALREIQKEKYWRSNQKASKEVHDETAFRFVTNFVRAKRLGDDLESAAREASDE